MAKGLADGTAMVKRLTTVFFIQRSNRSPVRPIPERSPPVMCVAGINKPAINEPLGPGQPYSSERRIHSLGPGRHG